jgi:hypothetical protein
MFIILNFKYQLSVGFTVWKPGGRDKTRVTDKAGVAESNVE